MWLQNGRSCLGDLIYRYITSDQFSAECLLDCLDLSSEHVALEIANRVEASIYVWRRRAHSKPPVNPSRSTAKSSWGMVKDLMVDGDKRELLAERAESLLLCLKQQFPTLTQTTLDISKIQCNKVQVSFRDMFCIRDPYPHMSHMILNLAGYREVHSGELLKSIRKLGIQYRSSN